LKLKSFAYAGLLNSVFIMKKCPKTGTKYCVIFFKTVKRDCGNIYVG